MMLNKSYKSLFLIISFLRGESGNVLHCLMDKGCRGLRLLVERLFDWVQGGVSHKVCKP